jgi:phage terminase small subunit
MAGRPPKATKLHVIQGTARPDRMKKRKGEPVPSGGIGEPPEWLPPAAQEVWREIVAGYGEVAVLTAVDRHHLATYCDMFARWKEAVIEGTPYSARQVVALASLGGKLGLNPSDRARLKTPEPPKRDPFDDLLA